MFPQIQLIIFTITSMRHKIINHYSRHLSHYFIFSWFNTIFITYFHSLGILFVILFFWNIVITYYQFSVLDKGAVHAIAAKWTLLAQKIMEKRSEYFNAHQDLDIPGRNFFGRTFQHYSLNKLIVWHTHSISFRQRMRSWGHQSCEGNF